MDVHIAGKDAKAVRSLPEVVTAVAERLEQEQKSWHERLLRDPSRFGEVEVAVHHTFQELADQVVAGLLGEVGQAPVLEQACKKSH